MMLHDFVYVERPADEVGRQLLHGRGEWLGPLAISAANEGSELLVRIGPMASLPTLSKVTRVHLGEPIQRGDVMIVPMVWEATRVPSAFPVLEADLEVGPVGPGTTQLSLFGRYRPPLGAVGEQINRVFLHRIAEASVRAFLRRLAATLSITTVPK